MARTAIDTKRRKSPRTKRVTIPFRVDWPEGEYHVTISRRPDGKRRAKVRLIDQATLAQLLIAHARQENSARG